MKIEIPSAEYELILLIRKRVFVEEQGIALELEIDETELLATYFLTALDLKPLATGRLRVVERKVKFERIATLKEARGRGEGRGLMDFMLSYAKKTYPTLCPYLHAQESSVGFYEKLGWRKTGPIFFEAGISHQAMIYQN